VAIHRLSYKSSVNSGAYASRFGNALNRCAQNSLSASRHHATNDLSFNHCTLIFRALITDAKGPQKPLTQRLSGCPGATQPGRLGSTAIHIDNLPSAMIFPLMRQQDFLRREMRYDFP
jgi:hypothetical protein